jgi:peroxiredoxin
MRTICMSAGFILTCVMMSLAQPKAPDFTLNDLAGKSVSLSSLEGKIVVVDFWAMWCTACKEAFGELNAISKELGEKNVMVVGINLEKAKPEKVAAFVKKAGIDYTVLLDPETSTAKLFTIKGVPSLVIIDKKQNIVKMFRGMNKSTEKEIKDLLTRLVSE